MSLISAKTPYLILLHCMQTYQLQRGSKKPAHFKLLLIQRNLSEEKLVRSQLTPSTGKLTQNTGPILVDIKRSVPLLHTSGEQ